MIYFRIFLLNGLYLFYVYKWIYIYKFLCNSFLFGMYLVNIYIVWGKESNIKEWENREGRVSLFVKVVSK